MRIGSRETGRADSTGFLSPSKRGFQKGIPPCAVSRTPSRLEDRHLETRGRALSIPSDDLFPSPDKRDYRAVDDTIEGAEAAFTC
jgi:hypothetical protein